MLTEKVVYDVITVLEDGQMQIRRARRIFDNGVQIAEQYHRHVLAPGDEITKEDARVRQIAAIIWTPQVIADYRAAQELTHLARLGREAR